MYMYVCIYIYIYIYIYTYDNHNDVEGGALQGREVPPQSGPRGGAEVGAAAYVILPWVVCYYSTL